MDIGISAKVADLIVNNKLKFFLAGLFVVFALGSYSTNVSMVNDAEVFLNKNDPLYWNKIKFEEEFSKDYSLELIVKINEGNLFEEKSLKLITDLTNDIWRIPHVQRVNSLANFQYMTAEGDDLVISELIEAKDRYSATDTQRVVDAVKNIEEIKRYLINDKYNLTVIRASLNISNGDDESKSQSASAVKSLIDSYQSNKEIEIMFAGALGVDTTLTELAQRNLSTVESPMILCFIVLIGLFFCSVRASIAALIVVVASIACTMGLAGLSGMQLSGANLVAIYLIMFLGLMDSIHLLSSYMVKLNSCGDHTNAMRKSLQSNMEGLFLTTTTTMVGFLAISASGSEGFIELGVLGAVGIFFAFFATIFMIPTVMIFGTKAHPQKNKNTIRIPVSHFFKWLFVNHEKKVFLTVAASIILSLPFMSKLYIETTPSEIFKEDSDIRIANNLSLNELAGKLGFNYVLDSGQEAGVYDTKFMRAVEKFSFWLESKEQVNKVKSYVDVVKRLNKKMHSDEVEYYRIPVERELLAQYGLLYELSLPSGVELTDQVTIDKRKLKLEIFTSDLSGVEYRKLHDEINEYLDNESDIARYYVFSNEWLFSFVASKNITGAFDGLVIALVVISIFMLIVCRSFKLGVISMLPNIMPILMTLSIWGMVHQSLHIITAVLLMGVGIIVDDTIHFVIRYRNALKAGKEAKEAVLEAFDTAGHAIVISSIVLTLGFAIPAIFASTNLTSLMYQQFAILAVSALVFDLLVLPSILLRTKSVSHKSLPQPQIVPSALNKP